jgi:hypothetical protein
MTKPSFKLFIYVLCIALMLASMVTLTDNTDPLSNQLHSQLVQADKENNRDLGETLVLVVSKKSQTQNHSTDAMNPFIGYSQPDLAPALRPPTHLS